MSTEARIGIVAGLLIVVVASAYFFYGNDSTDSDVLVSADPKLAQPPKIPASTDVKPKPTPTPAGKPLPAAPRPAAPANNPLAGSAGTAPPTPRPSPALPPRPAGLPGRPPATPANPANAATPRPSPTPGPMTMGNAGGSAAVPGNPPAAPPGASPAAHSAVRPDAAAPRSIGSPAPATTTQPTGVQYWPRRPTSAPAGRQAESPFSPRLRSEPSSELVDATRDNLKRDSESAPYEEDADEVVMDVDSDTAAPSGTADDAPSAIAARPSPAPAPSPVGTPSATTPVPSTGRPAAPPTARPAALPPPAEAWPKKHAIAQGDTLSSISDRYYGSSTPERIDFLLKANPQLKNPRAMKIGDQLTIPAWNKPAAAPTAGTSAASPRSGGTAPPSPTAPAPTTPAATVSTRTYEVSDGDSFYSIARSQLGNGARWQELLRLNEDLVNGDPKRLKPGMIIKLP